MAEQVQWHHFFGLSWEDFFQGSPITVEPERDLSEKKQLLDLVIYRPPGADLPRRMPDGFEELVTYNVVTFKSHWEPLSGYALDELVAHYINLLKQVSPSLRNLLPTSDFRRFAVCVSAQQALTEGNVLEPAGPAGVYHSRHNGSVIRVVVIQELAREEHNAMLLLFSGQEDLIDYAARHYCPFSPDTSTLLLNLVNFYRQEGFPVPETLEQLARRTIDELLRDLPPEKRLEGLSPEERMRGLTPDELEALAQRLRKMAARLLAADRFAAGASERGLGG